MPRKKFKLSHSLWGGAALVLAEVVLVRFVLASAAAEVLVYAVGVFGSVAVLYVATEIIEEVRSARHMLVLLSMLVAEFVVFFAVQYWCVLSLEPASFPTLHNDWLSLLLQSTMVFVFNPLFVPATLVGRALLLINTLSALGLVLFILQNVWQFRRV